MKKKLLCLLMLIVGLGPGKMVLSAAEIDRVLAVVNDEIITLSELEDRKQKLIAEMTRLVNSAELQQKIDQVEEQTLSMMIEEMLILQKANEMGITIDEEAIDEALASVMSANKLETQEELEQALNSEGMTIADYKGMVEKQLKIYRLQSYEIKSKVRIIESEIKDYYTQNPEQFVARKRYHIRHIMLQITSLRPEEETRDRAEMIYNRLVAGADFCELAGEFSDDPTGKECGDLGIVDEKNALPEFMEVLSKLQEGAYSLPFQTRYGYHIVHLLTIEGGGNLPYEKVRDMIRDLLFDQKFSKKREEWLTELKKSNYIKIITHDSQTTQPD